MHSDASFEKIHKMFEFFIEPCKNKQKPHPMGAVFGFILPYCFYFIQKLEKRFLFFLRQHRKKLTVKAVKLTAYSLLNFSPSSVSTSFFSRASLSTFSLRTKPFSSSLVITFDDVALLIENSLSTSR